jgi:poly-gamma-glutamate synthesis protein (capsule biosynthesis protein)
LTLKPTQTRHFRVNRSPDEGEVWLLVTLNREGQQLGTRVERTENHTFLLRWQR